MPKLFVFAIGGTGERVLRSLNMVLASGAPTFDNYEVFPIIIDYDKDNEDKKRTVELLQNYADIHEAAFKRHGVPSGNDGQSGQFFAAKLSCLHGLKNYVFPFEPATKHEKFRQNIGYDKLAGGTLLTKDLLESLYDESDRTDTELNLDMDEGFRGNPNIGSVVFHANVGKSEFTTFISNFQPAGGDKVIIIGSLFGGTGASGIPEIVKAINSMKPGYKNSVATILVLPYFAPVEKKGGTIKASRFNSKTKAALSFYEDSGLKNMVGKIYYVGDYYPTVVKYSEGGGTQKNNANLVELIAAMMIEHFVAGREVKKQEFKFSMDADIVVRPEQKKKNGQRLFFDDFDVTSKNMVLIPLVELAIAMKFYHEEIKSKNKRGRGFYQSLNLEKAIDNTNANDKLSVLCAGLEKFYDYYQAWLKEIDFEGDGRTISANTHRLGLCDMKNPYADIVLKKENKKEQKTDIGRFKSLFGGSEKLNHDFLSTRMDKHFDGHLNAKASGLEVGHELEWVFADILHSTCVDGRKERLGL